MEQKMKNFEANKFFNQVKLSFHATCLTLLSLLLPLSYLLLARLTSSPPPSFTFNSIILYILVSFLSLSSLLSSITGYTLHIKLPNFIAWAFLCIFQACITYGIEATITSGFSGPVLHESWLKRTFLFVGIYEQMLLWKTRLVKPVVDDTLFDEETKEGGMEMFLMGLCFGVLWLLLLQREIETLVLSAEKRDRNFFLWLVMTATLITGFVRSVEFFVCQMGVMLQFMFCRVEEEADELMVGDNVV